MKIEGSTLKISKKTKFFKSELFEIWQSENIDEIDIENGVEKSVIFDALYFSLHRKCSVNLDSNLQGEFHKFYNSTDIISLKPDLTCLIIAYNNPTFVSNMCNQVKKITNDIVIINNNSNFGPMKNFLNTCGFEILHMPVNHGHKVYDLEIVKRIVGPVFLLTDPDMQISNLFTKQMVHKMYEISVLYGIRKVGVALDISAENLRDDVKYEGKIIKDWEQKFWESRVPDQELEMYWADVDTTFCLVNNNYNRWPYVRIAGDYTSKHLPWYKGWESVLIDGEYEAYMSCNRSTNWCKK